MYVPLAGNCLPLVYLLGYGNLVRGKIVVNQVSSSRSSRKSWTPSASRAACLLHGWTPYTRQRPADARTSRRPRPFGRFVLRLRPLMRRARCVEKPPAAWTAQRHAVLASARSTKHPDLNAGGPIGRSARCLGHGRNPATAPATVLSDGTSEAFSAERGQATPTQVVG